MSFKATISPGYRWRLALVAALLLGFGGWFLKDGYVTYPKERLIAEEFKQFSDEGRREQWPEYARAKGWPDGTLGPPGKDHSDWDILLQKILGFACLPVGLLFLIGTIRTLGRWIALDDQTLSTSAGHAVPLSAITRINKDRWQSKGIAIVYFTHEGRTGRIVLDDWKYDQKATEQILAEIEKVAAPQA